MLDIFFTEDLHALVRNKSIVFLGDSNTRALYKDFLCLLERNRLIPMTNLKAKMENSVFGDKLINVNGKRTNGRTFREERQFKGYNVEASYYFLTRVYDEYVQKVLLKITSNRKPDILIVNSMLWDVTRWGMQGVDEYKVNMRSLLGQLKLLLPDCLVIWTTAPPISQEVKGGFLVQDLQFLKYSLRFHVVEANHFARKIVVEHGFDVVDVHYHLKMQIHRREKDGIHWMPNTVRYITNLLLTHISLAWDKPLPHRYNSPMLAESLEKLDDVSTDVDVPEIKIQAQKKRPGDRVASKVQSKIAKPEKEDSDTPTPKRKKQNKQLYKPPRTNSHHAYFSKNQQKERINRIRKWGTKPQKFSYLTPNNPHHDSGYFPSPNEASLSNDSLHSNQRNIYYANSQCSSTVTSYQSSLNPSAAQSSWCPTLSRETYYSGSSNQETYYSGSSNQETYYSGSSNPATYYSGSSNQTYCSGSSNYAYTETSNPLPSRFEFGARRTIVQNPYVFPHAQQPTRDFTSDDFEAY